MNIYGVVGVKSEGQDILSYCFALVGFATSPLAPHPSPFTPSPEVM
ncbi:hypothetical protein [Fibrella aquatica]